MEWNVPAVSAGDVAVRLMPRDNQDESGATIKMREPVPVPSRREGVARPEAWDRKKFG
jgi:hypothetical protein